MAIPAALIAGASSSFSNAFNLALQTYTNDVNWHRQRAVNAENWQKYLYDNAYNTPVQQIQRLRAAGLNPALMYEGGGSIATSTPPSVSQSSHDVAPQMTGLPTLSDIVNAQLSKAQISLLQSQKDKLDAETKTEEQLRDERLNALIQQNANLAKSTEEIAERIKTYADSHKLTVAQIEQLKFDRVMQGKQYLLDKKRLLNEQKLTNKQIEKLDADIQKTLAEKNVAQREYQELMWTFAIRKTGLANQVNLTKAQIDECKATCKKLGLDYDMVEGAAMSEKFYSESLRGDHGVGNLIIANLRSGVQMLTRDFGNIFAIIK